MTLEHDLAMGVLVSHPIEAAQILERLPAEEAARFLSKAETLASTASLRAMHGPVAAEVLAALEVTRAAEIVGALPLDAASACLRRLAEPRREQILSQLPVRRARSLRSLLRFALNTAGSLMDPDVLALPADLSVADAIDRVREAAHDARYNIYTVDREQRLVGVFNLRELLLAEPKTPLSTIGRPNPHRIAAKADRHAIAANPGWLEVHALPVVDDDGIYLGAIRHRTLRRLEMELRGTAAESGATARALGDLFRAGATSLLEVIASSAPAPSGVGRSPDGP